MSAEEPRPEVPRDRRSAPIARDEALGLVEDDVTALVAEANAVIDARQVDTLFQPIVHLETAEVVGYEALTRGPAGSRLEAPLDLLRAGRLAGRLVELDWICAAAACRAALDADLHPSMTVFLNFEPETLLAPCPPDLLGPARQALEHLRVMIETKEDSLTTAPARLLEALALAHDVGWGVAIDNAEASSATLALLPLVHPDVLKLDLRHLRSDPLQVARMTDGARTSAERTGAMILAEQVEGPEDLLIASFAGATYGQGHHFGPPAPLPKTRVMPRSVFPLLPKNAFADRETPYNLVAERCPHAVTELQLLVKLSRYLENQVDAHGHPALLLVNFGADARRDAATRERLSSLAKRAAFMVAFGPDLAKEASANGRVNSWEIAPDDPITSEWIVIVLGTHYAAALVAHDLGDRVARPHRRFAYALTHDRELVRQAALAFLSRVPVVDAPLAS